jgi:hypothetical protein
MQAAAVAAARRRNQSLSGVAAVEFSSSSPNTVVRKRLQFTSVVPSSPWYARASATRPSAVWTAAASASRRRRPRRAKNHQPEINTAGSPQAREHYERELFPLGGQGSQSVLALDVIWNHIAIISHV